jgi:hypothetical protein
MPVGSDYIDSDGLRHVVKWPEVGRCDVSRPFCPRSWTLSNPSDEIFKFFASDEINAQVSGCRIVTVRAKAANETF